MHFLLLLGLIAFDGSLVLRNGKRIAYKDTYEVRDGFVFFHDARGDLFKLPLSIIDLDKTEVATEPAVAEPEPQGEQLTAFEKFVVDAEQRDGEEGGNLVLIQRSQQTVRSEPRTSPDKPATARVKAGPSPRATPEKRDAAGADCEVLKAKLGIIRKNRDAKKAELALEAAKNRPSARVTEKLTEDLAQIEGYLAGILQQLKQCE